MSEYSKERLRYLRLGISSYTEDELVLDVIGNVNISQDVSIGDISITSSGIITSSNPGVSTVVYYGDGSNLFGVSAFNVITQSPISNPVYPTFASNIGVSSVGISSSQLVFIPSSGFLGIGTTNPTSKLSVLGDLNVSGIITAETFYGDGSNLSNIISGVTIKKDDIIVGTSASTINFSGSGISSVTVFAGIATVYIPGTSKIYEYYTATEGQTTFYATYTTGYVDVYLNGVKLTQNSYTATDGLSVILNEGASVNDDIEIVGYLTYNVPGFLYADYAANSGISTFSRGLIGTPDLQVGFVTATKYFGDGSSLTNIITGIGISNFDTSVGTGITVLNFRGVGITSITSSSGIATIDVLNSPINLLNVGIVSITSGIITASSGIVTYYGDGSNLTGVTGNFSLGISTSSSTNYVTFVDSSSATSIGITQTNLTFVPSTGNLSATQFTSLSDRTQKKNIRKIENALDIVNQLEGVRFDWVDNNKHSMGVIAQDIEKVLPEVVETAENGRKSVSYGNIIGVLIEAIKEQQKRIEDLEGRL